MNMSRSAHIVDLVLSHQPDAFNAFKLYNKLTSQTNLLSNKLTSQQTHKTRRAHIRPEAKSALYD